MKYDKTISTYKNPVVQVYKKKSVFKELDEVFKKPEKKDKNININVNFNIKFEGLEWLFQ